MQLRSLTADGVREARAMLDAVRADPSADLQPLRMLLTDPAATRPVADGPDLPRRRFVTRRAAAEYLAPLLHPIRQRIVDDGSVWSWLGLYYFEDTVRRREEMPHLPARDHDIFLFPQRGQSMARKYRHYLWSAWRLQLAHGETALYLLDRELTEFGDLAKALFGSPSRFNAVGIIPLVGQLYIEGSRTKRGFTSGPGSLWHLTRVLEQLERTYDVYGMTAEALLSLLPADFDHWRL